MKDASKTLIDNQSSMSKSKTKAAAAAAAALVATVSVPVPETPIPIPSPVSSTTTFSLHIDPVKIDRDFKMLERIQSATSTTQSFNPMVTKLEDLGIDEKQINIEPTLTLRTKANTFHYFSHLHDYLAMKAMPNSTTIPCFYCTEPFSNAPLGIPVGFVPSYYEQKGPDGECYPITLTSAKRKNEVKELGHRVIERDYYETDGNFCSFPCMIAYYGQHRDMYTDTTMPLMKRMHMELMGHALPRDAAPSIRLLKKFGGHLSINEWRSVEGRHYVMSHQSHHLLPSDIEVPTMRMVPCTRLFHYRGTKLI